MSAHWHVLKARTDQRDGRLFWFVHRRDGTGKRVEVCSCKEFQQILEFFLCKLATMETLEHHTAVVQESIVVDNHELRSAASIDDKNTRSIGANLLSRFG